MKLIELVDKCSMCQMFSIRNYDSGVTIYRGLLSIDDFICQYEVRLISTQDGFLVVYVDVE